MTKNLYEEWRDISGYEGFYQVSSFGRIRSVDHYRASINGSRQLSRGRILKIGFNSGTGYATVSFSKHGCHHSRDVHRVVAETFIPNPKNLPCIDHIDGDKTNNNVNNLRWVSQKENIQYAIDDGRIDLKAKSKILNDPYVRLSNLMILRHAVKRNDGVIFDSVTEAAEYTGCSRRAITKVLNGDNKTCYGYTFEYVDRETI